MIELDTGATASASDLIKDVNESTFMKDAVEASDLVLAKRLALLWKPKLWRPRVL